MQKCPYLNKQSLSAMRSGAHLNEARALRFVVHHLSYENGEEGEDRVRVTDDRRER